MLAVSYTLFEWTVTIMHLDVYADGSRPYRYRVYRGEGTHLPFRRAL
jgi:hypothetical protein